MATSHILYSTCNIQCSDTDVHHHLTNILQDILHRDTKACILTPDTSHLTLCPFHSVSTSPCVHLTLQAGGRVGAAQVGGGGEGRGGGGEGSEKGDGKGGNECGGWL